MQQRKAAAEKYGVEFFQLSDKDMGVLIKQASGVHQEFASEINKNYGGDKYKPANFLKEVQDYMGFAP
jgi:ABC-type microcin C transport system permease subunit YejB